MADATNSTAEAASMTYGQLSQRSPEYDAETWQLLDDLFSGGFEIEKRAKRYIPKLVGERTNRYEERLRSGSYINYFNTIVSFFVAALFTQEIAVTEAADSDNAATPGGKADADFYTRFAKNADGCGHTLQKVLRGVLTTALKKQRAFVLVDFPKRPEGAEDVNTRADEEALGLDAVWCRELPIEQVIDWDHDDDGELAWAIVHRCEQRRMSPRGDRATIVETFKVWEREGDAVSWSLYRLAYAEKDKPKPETPVPLVDDGTVSFKRIPLLELCLPEELCVGHKIGPNAREHYQRRTSLNGAENKSLVALPVAALGPEMTAPGQAMPSEKAQNPNRGDDPVGRFLANGFQVTGSQDKVYFAEPEGRCYELVDKQLDKLKDEMFRVVHQIALSVGNDSTSMRRSGESKKQDKSDIATVLGALGSEVRAFAVKLYETISQARGEDVVWTPHGLDDYDTESREDLIAEAGAMGTLDIPSVTFWKQYKTQIALKLAQNLPPETQEQIRGEIQDGVAHEQQIRSIVDAPSGEDDTNDPDSLGDAPAQAGGAVEPPSMSGKPAANGAPPGSLTTAPAPKAAVAKPASRPASPVAKKTVQGPDGSTHELFDPADRMRASDESPGIAEKVYRDLAEDYDEDQIEWVRTAQWRGPLVVPLSEIDFTNAGSWPASEDKDHVGDFEERIQSDGFVKPIILVNEPNNDKLIIADGHHRALAYRKLGQNPMAYVANVGAVQQDDGNDRGWRVMHDSQRGGSDQKA